MAYASMAGRIRMLNTRHPIIKGMVSYAILWPCGSAIQQVIEGKTLETFDWKRCFRFSIYGAFVVAPMLHGWVRLSSTMWPATSLKIGLIKAAVEQVSYGPFAMSCFYVGMNLLEFKSLNDGIEELRLKFWPTFKVGVCVWPIVQTINFSMVPERNRVVFVSIISVMWTTYLAYMKSLEDDTKVLKLKPLPPPPSTKT
ncbi:mpv17-like protein [Eupeodes corollae]|uniref:mpv17-like protein n=1 Tax=Eupeodes corollae TaxID=290404 RepID=UPI00248FD8D9|nr:mpv17-like protein [Eupeodes corollae]XP_055914195.1 mpv17-like protein [Eupeodes corollae]XP_055914196.1 mpv17-like protein [Eupeodes corollae]XP_055914197.1 mpv17-like protein [Eupeodes corollae]